MVNNSTNINKTDNHFTFTHWTQLNKTMAYDVENQGMDSTILSKNKLLEIQVQAWDRYKNTLIHEMTWDWWPQFVRQYECAKHNTFMYIKNSIMALFI